MYRIIAFVIALLLLAGCVGTDLVTEPETTPADEPFIMISEHQMSLMPADMLQLMAKAYQAAGVEASNIAIDWSTTNQTVLTINNAGKLTAHDAGQSYVIASAPGYVRDSTLITVVTDSDQIARIVIREGDKTINRFQTAQFNADAYNSRDEVVASTGFTWASSNTGVATIDENGNASAQSTGTTQITASLEGVVSTPVTLTVVGTSKSGTFQANPNTSYTVSGRATLENHPSGNLMLTFSDDFQSSNGPGLHVYASPTQSVTSSSIDLGTLQSTSGVQTYTLPDDTNLADINYIIIHCVPFNVTFGFAIIN